MGWRGWDGAFEVDLVREGVREGMVFFWVG